MATLPEDRVSCGRRVASSALASRTSRPLFTGMMLVPSSHPRTAKAPTRQAVSNPLRGEGLHHDVHGEAPGVDRLEAVVLGMVVPLRAVVLAAVQHADAAVALVREQMLVDEIIAPSVQFVARRRRSVEFKEC